MDPIAEIASAADALMGATCRKQIDRAKARLRSAIARAGKPAGEDPVHVLAREMADLLAADYDDDPLAVALVERAVGLGVTTAHGKSYVQWNPSL